MFSFFGTFLDGPLAGSTFEGVVGDSSGGGGGTILPLVGIATILAIVGYAVIYFFVAPFATWYLMFKDESIMAIFVFILIEFVYMLFRIRHNVKHWNVSFIKELLYNTLYFIVLYLIMAGIIVIPIIFATEGATMGNYLLQHYGQWLYEVFFSQIFGLLFFAVPLSVIPALLTTGASYLFLGKVAKIAKVKI